MSSTSDSGTPLWWSQCNAYPGDTEDYLLTAERGLVVIANGYGWFDDRSGVAVGVPGDSPSRDPEVKLGALSWGLSAAVHSLQDAGHTVLLVQAVPRWREEEPLNFASCSMLDMATVGCSETMSVSGALEHQGEVADVVAAVARETGAEVLDVTSELCPNGTCTSEAPDGLVRYRDGGHITVEQSEALAGTFEKAIAAAG